MKTYEKNPVPRELFGDGTSKDTGKRLKALGAKKCVIITDEGIVNAGILTGIEQSIKDEGIEVLVYSKVQPDPTDVSCYECGDYIKEVGADSIVAVGGGSPIDLAKVAALMTGIPEKIESISDYAVGGTKMKASYRRQVNAIYIPTTAGTGAESTLGGMIIDTKTNVKVAVFNESMMPDLVIVDPELTYGMPAYPTACCGLDVIAHCVEHLIGPKQLEFQDLILFDAAERAWKWLPIVLKDLKNAEGRSQLAWASHQSLCNGGASVTHAVAHALGGIYHEYRLVHGHMCAVALPAAIRWHAESRAGQIYQLAERFGIACYESEDAKTIADRVADAIVSFYKACGMKTLSETFKEKEIPDDFDTMVKKLTPAIHADVNFYNFVPPIHESDDEIKHLLKMIWDEE